MDKNVKINACLDDEAFKVGEFIQELSKIQEEYFQRLVEKVKEKEWAKEIDEQRLEDFLFDYCYNGWDIDSQGFEQTFSEYLESFSGNKVDTFLD